MIHFLALLTDLITDSECLRTMVLRVSSFGLANSAMILLFGVVQVVRRWKVRNSLPVRGSIFESPGGTRYEPNLPG